MQSCKRSMLPDAVDSLTLTLHEPAGLEHMGFINLYYPQTGAHVC